MELCDKATRPCGFAGLRISFKRVWINRTDIPSLWILQHVTIRFNLLTLRNVLIFSSELCMAVFLEGTMILIELIKTIIDLWILKLNIEFKTDFTDLSCTPCTFTPIVVADLKIVQILGFLVKQVSKSRKQQEYKADQIEATTESWSHNLVRHYVVEHSLFHGQVLRV